MKFFYTQDKNIVYSNMTEYNGPKSMDELEKMFYGENKDGLNVDTKKLQSYHDQIRTEITSPDNEKFIERLFEPLGDIQKINETDEEKTSDFVVKDK